MDLARCSCKHCSTGRVQTRKCTFSQMKYFPMCSVVKRLLQLLLYMPSLQNMIARCRCRIFHMSDVKPCDQTDTPEEFHPVQLSQYFLMYDVIKLVYRNIIDILDVLLRLMVRHFFYISRQGFKYFFLKCTKTWISFPETEYNHTNYRQLIMIAIKTFHSYNSSKRLVLL